MSKRTRAILAGIGLSLAAVAFLACAYWLWRELILGIVQDELEWHRNECPRCMEP